MNFKKTLLIFSIVYSTISFSQITTTKIEVVEKIKEQKVYDGKSDFEVSKNTEDYRQYIGQKIYTTKSYSTIYSTNGKKYEDYKNKYFTVKDLAMKKGEYTDDDNTIVTYTKAFFKLTNDENGETYYYPLEQEGSNFILVSYFLNLKKTYESKKYVMVSYWREDGFKNEATNEWIVVNKKIYGGEWNCEVSIIEKDGIDKIFYIMKSNAGEIISSETIDGSSSGKFRIVTKLGNHIFGGIYFMSNEDYNAEIASKNIVKNDVILKNNKRISSLTQKYGKEKGELISNGKVAIGMTKEMCKESWGIPLRTDVEKTSKITKETLVYGWSKRLHFENAKLVKIEY